MIKFYSVSFFVCFFMAVQAQTIIKVDNGIWKIVSGQPEKILPDQFKAPAKTAALAAMPAENTPLFL